MKSRDDAAKIIDILLKYPAGLKKEQIMRKTGLGSESTFYRALRTAKIMTNCSIECSNGKYNISESSYSPENKSVLPDDDELIAFVTIDHIISSMTTDTLQNAFAPVRKRVEKIVNLTVKEPAKWAKHIKILDTHYRKIEEGVFAKITQAIARKRVLKLQYIDHNGKKTIRTVSPQQLVRYKDNWYLDGWCHSINELRIFSLDCIKELKYDNHVFFTADDNMLNRTYATSYGIFSGIATGTAKIQFSGNAARYAEREIWHPKQKLIKLENGNILLEIPFNKTPELVGAILSWGEEAEVIYPASLREEISMRIKKMASLYEKGTPMHTTMPFLI